MLGKTEIQLNAGTLAATKPAVKINRETTLLGKLGQAGPTLQHMESHALKPFEDSGVVLFILGRHCYGHSWPALLGVIKRPWAAGSAAGLTLPGLMLSMLAKMRILAKSSSKIVLLTHNQDMDFGNWSRRVRLGMPPVPLSVYEKWVNARTAPLHSLNLFTRKSPRFRSEGIQSAASLYAW